MKTNYENHIKYIVLILFIGFISFICIRITLPREKTVKIGVTYMTMNNDFYKVLNSKIEKMAFYKKYKLIVRNPELDEEKQASQIESFIKEKVNVIIINPVKSKSKVVNKALIKAKEKDIPVVAVDAPISNKDIVSSTILSDNYEAGVLLAKYLIKTKKKANILLLEHKNVISATDRINGFIDTIKKHKDYHIVKKIETYGQTEIAMPKVEKAISEAFMEKSRKNYYKKNSNNYFDIVMALNDRAAIGALAAIESKQVINNVSIFGVDGSPDFKQFIADNPHATATVSQSISLIADKLSYVIERLLKQKKVKKLYKIPVTLINKDNVNYHKKLIWE